MTHYDSFGGVTRFTIPADACGSHGFMVTSSSADVGWMATVESKSAFVAPIFMAMAKP